MKQHPLMTPPGHSWDGTSTNILVRRGDFIATGVGTFQLKFGVWRLMAAPEITIDPDEE